MCHTHTNIKLEYIYLSYLYIAIIFLMEKRFYETV
jgi:hypothetical protein